jgi:MFS family permease
MTGEQRPVPGVWLAAVAGLAATLIGNGLGRFAYTPLIPALIAAGWFAPAEAVYLAAANLAGYLVGAMGARRFAVATSGTFGARTAMVATVLSLVACAFPLGFAWYAFWRFLAGVTGGVLMVLAVPMVLGATPSHLRGRVAGVVITGVGLGVAASGTIVPAIAAQGLTLVWFALAATAALLTAYAWFMLPADTPAMATRAGGARLSLGIVLLLAAYACDALGFIPHTVFWVDYIARGLGQGLEAGGAQWIIVGLGAAGGPFLVGLLADRIGFGPSYILAMAAKAGFVALPLVSTGVPMLVVSSVGVGALIAGTTTLCSGWVAERVGLAHHRQVWGWMTSAFGIAQAAGAWAMSHLFAVTGAYTLLFVLGSSALTLGALLALASARQR